MTSRNDVTEALLVSKPSNEQYAEGWDRVFGKKDDAEPDEQKEDDHGSDDL